MNGSSTLLQMCFFGFLFFAETHKHCAAQTDNSAAVEALFLACLSQCGHDSKFYEKP